jgi:hypothetical protein
VGVGNRPVRRQAFGSVRRRLKRWPAWLGAAVLVVVPAGVVKAMTSDTGAKTGAARERAAAVHAHLVVAKHPVLVYVAPGGADEARLNGTWIDPRSIIRLDRTREASVSTVTFFVDEPQKSTRLFAVDRKPPFVLPRKGQLGKRPYSLGPHSLRADVELRNGRKLRLSLSYTSALTLSVPASVDAATLQHDIESMPAGALNVRPAQGATSFAVSGGDLTLNRASVRLDHAVLSGTVEFDPGASGSSLVNSQALGFSIFGADDILVSGNTLDGRGVRNQNVIWDEPAGNTPDRFVIRGNEFRNFYIDNAGDVHSEALYIGYSTNGLIENNNFQNNGNTSHIFFTWFGTTADPAVSYPRNMCVRGNTFGPTHGAFFDVNMRGEIPLSANIRVQPGADNARPEFTKAC